MVHILGVPSKPIFSVVVTDINKFLYVPDNDIKFLCVSDNDIKFLYVSDNDIKCNSLLNLRTLGIHIVTYSLMEHLQIVS